MDHPSELSRIAEFEGGLEQGQAERQDDSVHGQGQRACNYLSTLQTTYLRIYGVQKDDGPDGRRLRWNVMQMCCVC